MLKFLFNTRIYFFVLLGFLFHEQAGAQLTYNELSVQYDSPWTFKKLQLIPIRFKGSGNGKDSNNADHTMFNGNVISIGEALNKHKITVKEMSDNGGPDVSTLEIKNRSQENIMLMSGEMMQGGKQDRAIGATTIIPPGRQQKLCVCILRGKRTMG